MSKESVDQQPLQPDKNTEKCGCGINDHPRVQYPR